jgi:GT2 family glycosyltransferase
MGNGNKGSSGCPVEGPTDGERLKGQFLVRERLALHSFLAAGRVLDCDPPPGTPARASVLLLAHNRAELTLACIKSLVSRKGSVPLEIILVDNGSTDETRDLLGLFRGLTVLRNRHNVGYPRGVNQAARRAQAEYLLLLNNDALVLGRGIETAVGFLDAVPRAGAVGGKILLLDGSLQEAGCSVREDGWTRQHGRGWPPSDIRFSFPREVDYCSAAFLLTRRRLFRDLGGLDEAFSPGYFEDVDYCVRLRQAGHRVVYLPDIATVHYENATSASLLDLHGLCVRNHARFVARHAGWLRSQQERPAAPGGLLGGLRRLLAAPKH